MKKISSIVTLDNKEMKLKIGTVDKKNTDVVYFDGGLYVMPIEERENYKRDFQQIRKEVNQNIKNELLENDLFKNNYMSFFDVATDWMSPLKKSYFSFQIYLNPKENSFSKLIENNNVNSFINDLNIKEILNSFGYKCFKTKK